MSTSFKENIYKLLSVVVKTNLEIIYDDDIDICNIIKLNRTGLDTGTT